MSFTWVAFVGPTIAMAQELVVPSGQSQRTWEDQSGQYKIPATLLNYDDAKVRLKKADGRVIEVDRSILSEKDQAFLRKDKQLGANPFAGGSLMPPESNDVQAPHGIQRLSGSGGVEVIAIDKEVEPIEVANSPRPSIRPLKPSMQRLPAEFKGRIYGRPYQLSGEEDQFIFANQPAGDQMGAGAAGRIWITTPSTEPQLIDLRWQRPIRLLDHHAELDQTLILVGGDDQSEPELQLLTGIGEGQPTIVEKWHLPQSIESNVAHQVEFARLLGDRDALIHLDGNVWRWNLDSGLRTFHFDDLTDTRKTPGKYFHVGGIAIDPAGHRLAIARSKSVLLFDLSENASLGRINDGGRIQRQLAFSPSGNQLAIILGGNYQVWDLNEARMTMSAKIGYSAGTLFGWINDHQLMTAHGGLIDRRTHGPIWNYNLSAENTFALLGNHLTGMCSLDDTPYFAVLPTDGSPLWRNASTSEAIPKTYLALDQSTPMTLDLQIAPEADEALIQRLVRQAAAHANWELSDDSSVRLVATVRRADPRTIQFGRQPGEAKDTTVRYVPFESVLEIRQGDEVLWQQSAETKSSGMVRRRADETLQQAVTRGEVPNLEFFEQVTLPTHVLSTSTLQQVETSFLRQRGWSK